MTTKIEYKQPRFYAAEGVQLAPGMNLVADDRAAVFLANPGVKARVNRGDIIVHESNKGVDGNNKEPNAKELARDIIPSTFDVIKLREWADDDRKTVADAAKARLDELDDEADDDGN